MEKEKQKDELEGFFPKNKTYFWVGGLLLFVLVVFIFFKKMNSSQM